MTTCIPFQKDHGNYRCTTCAWASTIVIGTYHWCVGLLPMPSKINAPEDQKPSNNEINAFDPGRVAKEEQKKARAKVISTTAKNNNSGMTGTGTRTEAFRNTDMNIQLADTTAIDVALILPMDHLLLLHDHKDGKAGTVELANRYNG